LREADLLGSMGKVACASLATAIVKSLSDSWDRSGSPKDIRLTMPSSPAAAATGIPSSITWIRPGTAGKTSRAVKVP
jgi:hypothetical protein